MSKWGVFIATDGVKTERHVGPVDPEGFAAGEHVFCPYVPDRCYCKPIKREDGVWVHNDPERGGLNS